jgi:hypothetical protein
MMVYYNVTIILFDLERPKKTPVIVFQAWSYSFHFKLIIHGLFRYLRLIEPMAHVQPE